MSARKSSDEVDEEWGKGLQPKEMGKWRNGNPTERLVRTSERDLGGTLADSGGRAMRSGDGKGDSENKQN